MKKFTLVILTFALMLTGTKVSAQGKYGARCGFIFIKVSPL